MTDPGESWSPRDSRLRYLLPVLVLAWLVAVPLLGLRAIGQSVTFFGEQPTRTEQTGTESGLALAAAVAVLLALLGTVVAVRARARFAAVVFVLLLLMSFGVAGLAGSYSFVLHRDDPPPPSAPTSYGCQEHSGGDTRCPGG